MLRSIDPILIYRWKGSSKLTKNLTGATSFKAYKIYIELQLDIIVIWKHCSVKQLFTFHNGEVFSLYMGMKIPCWVEIGMGKFPHSSLKAHNIFPIHGLAVVVKRNFPIRGFAAHGEISFHHSCKAIHGENIMCLSWFMAKFIFPLSWLRHSSGKTPSLFLLSMGLAHSTFPLKTQLGMDFSNPWWTY